MCTRVKDNGYRSWFKHHIISPANRGWSYISSKSSQIIDIDFNFDVHVYEMHCLNFLPKYGPSFWNQSLLKRLIAASQLCMAYLTSKVIIVAVEVEKKLF